MATSPNLEITHLTQAQAQKHVTVNGAIDAIDRAVAGHRTNLDFPSDANFTPSATDVRNSFSIDVGGGTLTAERQFIIPLTTHLYLIGNNTAGSQSIEVIGTTGTGVVIDNGDRSMVFVDGTNVTLVSGAGASSSSPYEMGAFISGVPTVSAMIFKGVVARTVTFVDDFVGSEGHCETAPDALTEFDIQVNSVSIGTMSFAMSATTATFLSTGPDVLSAGDTLEVHSPSDLNILADLSFMLVGTR